jgi:drug/metabolite transporter (DMT)-like permease
MNKPLGIALYLGQVFLFSLNTAIVHQIGSSATVMQLTLLRNLSMLVIAFLLFGRLSLDILGTSILRLQLLRALLTVATMWLTFWSFAHLPLADATAISYAEAIFLTLLPIILLGETVPLIRWGGLLAGFIGTLMMIRPVFAALDWSYLVPLLAAGVNALVLVISKPMQKTDSTATLVVYIATIGIVCNLPDLLISPLPDVQLWPWLLGILTLGPLGQLCGILAVRHCDISLLAPWFYLRLVLASLIGGVAFYEVPSAWTLLGATIVFVSCGLTLGRSRRLSSGRPSIGGHKTGMSPAVCAASHPEER